MLVAVLLLGALVAVTVGWISELSRVKELQAEVNDLQKKEMRSSVMRSVSKQMEEIAFQQKAISDEQREEAIQQTHVANEMRRNSEIARQNAIEAEQNAHEQERKAIKASRVAENQRQIAEHQRLQAEFSKHVADTLSYIALGRSLGSLALTQYEAGNRTTAAQLTYASYMYTTRYDGDVYYPSVLQSLMRVSESKRRWTDHVGSVTALTFMPGQYSDLISVSTYGEVIKHVKDGNGIKAKPLLSDKGFDFRDVIIDKSSTIFALSRTGHLFICRKDEKRIVPLPGLLHPTALQIIDDRTLLIVGEKCMASFDVGSLKISDIRQTDIKVTCVSRFNGHPVLIDSKNRMHIVKSLKQIDVKQTAVMSGRITAYASSKSTGYEAYGLSDGTIMVVDRKGNVQKLLGHQSRVSHIKINGKQLYSSSYDGTLNLWMLDAPKIEPIHFISTGAWIMKFTFDNSKQRLWACDYSGAITEALISVPRMAQKVSSRVERNLTRDEWNYFIGENVPYENIKK